MTISAKNFPNIFLFISFVIIIPQRYFYKNFKLLFLPMQNNVLILDFGSQYTQLIARRVRELNIFCEIKPYNHLPEDLSEYKAVILSGSPFSVRGDDAPHPDLSQIKGKNALVGCLLWCPIFGPF